MDDHELLRAFLCEKSQDAFRRLMERHLPMVYSAACRMVCDSGLAQDVAQKVFLTLAEKGSSIKAPQVVGGWLYNTTRNIAMHTVRAEQRRREREQIAASMRTQEPEETTARILADLEPAMAELDAADRDALVLRYFENRSLRDVGSELGVSEDAARMRINRAEERLRRIFERQGVTAGAAGLAAVLGASTVAAVPAGLTGAIAATVFGGTATATAAIATMNWINVKSIAAIASAVVLTGAGTYLVQHRQLEQLQRDHRIVLEEKQTLETELAAAVAASRLAAEQADIERQNTSELLRLRSQVGQLREQLSAATRASEDTVRVSRAAPPPEAPSPRVYRFSREQLAHGGYNTPEAALQTAAWAVIQGEENGILETLSPELMADQAAIRVYRRNQRTIGPILQSVNMLAKKSVSDTEVQIKVEYEVSMGGTTYQMYAVTPLLKGPNGWKLGITRDYAQDWEKTGTVETLGGN